MDRLDDELRDCQAREEQERAEREAAVSTQDAVAKERDRMRVERDRFRESVSDSSTRLLLAVERAEQRVMGRASLRTVTLLCIRVLDRGWASVGCPTHRSVGRVGQPLSSSSYTRVVDATGVLPGATYRLREN